MWWSEDGRVGLGHRRLAIIDLSAAGRQPMTDASGSLQIVFNGEIYNYQELRKELEALGHRFRTATDTEVILEAYLDVGRRLSAAPERHVRVRAVRRAGRSGCCSRATRPARNRSSTGWIAGALAFASEFKALLADPVVPAGAGCRTRSMRTWRSGMCRASAASCAASTSCHRVMRSPSTSGQGRRARGRTGRCRLTSQRTATDDELLDELERLLADSVRLRLIADVPVGIMLSGGVDSSLVAAMAARVSSRRIKTFNISFPGHGAFDESPYARAVARHFGTEHVELAAEPATVDLLPELARQYDEPIADSSMVPTYLVSRLIRRDATVALGGDGGDELFGGYFQHSWVQQQGRIGDWIPRPAQRAARSAVTRLMPVGTRGRNYLLGLTAGHPFNIVQFNVIFDADARQRLLAPLGAAPTGAWRP